MKTKNVIVSLIPAVLGLLLSIGVMTLFSACGAKEDGTWMHCHDAQLGAAACGAVTAVLCLISSFLKNRIVKILLNTISLAAAAAAFLFPGTIVSMCMMRSMRCYTVMQPYARILAVLIAVFCLLNIIRGWKGSADR